MATPTCVKAVAKKPSGERRKTADSIPSGTATIRLNTSAAMPSWKVAGRRATISSRTEEPFCSDLPRSPCTMWLTQRMYWIGYGWSRPSSRRAAS